MLAIPNTTTVASESTPGFVAFPPDVGALTYYSQGYLFVANNSAQIAIKRGPSAAEAAWTPYALISPSLVPITTDRTGKKRPDYIFGIKFIDGVPNTHAQIFGALFQPGEAVFTPGSEFTGTVSPSGGFTPPVSQGLNLFQQQTLAAPAASFTFSPIPQTGISLLLHCQLFSTRAAGDDTAQMRINNDASASYLNELIQGNGAGLSASGTGPNTAARIGAISAATAPRNSGGIVVEIPWYTLAGAKDIISRASAQTGLSLFEDDGNEWGNGAVTRLDIFPGAGPNFAAGSSIALWVMS